MKKTYAACLFYVFISISLVSCKLVNAPFYLSCYDNPKVSDKPIHEAFSILWTNHPENRVDFETLLSIARANPKIIENGNYLSSLGEDTDEQTKRLLEKEYFVNQAANPDGHITYYWQFKSRDQTRIYAVKSMTCSPDITSSNKKEDIDACSFCLMSVLHLPVDINSRWKTYFAMTAAERKENNRLFKEDIIDNI